jgi:hypothetical protein
MLDECKGEKFEEMLAAFGMVVLRKSVGSIHRQPTVKPEHVLPLILAHRVSLQNTLRKRQELRDQAKQYNEILSRHEQSLTARMDTISQLQSSETSPLSLEEQDVLRDQITRAFSSIPHWTTYILEGNPSAAAQRQVEEDLAWPFLDSPDDEDNEAAKILKPMDPLEKLNSTITNHQANLDRLTSLRSTLLTSINDTKKDEDEKLPATSSPLRCKAQAKTQESSGVRFARHQGLSLYTGKMNMNQEN